MESKSLFARSINPLKQVVFILGFFVVVVMIIFGLTAAGVIEKDPIYMWEAAFTSVMIYVIFSSALCFSYPVKTKYFAFAILGFVLMLLITGGIAYVLGPMGIEDARADSFRWLYVVFTFSYLVLLSIVNAIHKILEIVKKQDARLRGEDS